MKFRNTILTGASSYIQIGAIMLTQLVAIPMALRFLDNERFGLWSFTSQSLGYLLLLDFGVTNSIGRLLTDPLQGKNEKVWNGWINLFLAILTVQGLLVLGTGLFLADSILHWFHIPAPLFSEARTLWISTLFLNALGFPFRILNGILGAQNRSYWYYFSTSAGAFLGLGVFFVTLKLGFGSLAYVFSLASQTGLNIILIIIAVLRGPNRIRISLQGIPWQHARELFGFSSAVFVINIAVQVVLMSPSLVITRVLGLGAVASYLLCAKVPTLLMQLIWRPFDAFNPRWQICWVNGETESLNREFVQMLRFTIGLTFLAMTCSLAMNRWFVLLFGKEQLYIGKDFDFWFAVFAVAQIWNRCLAISFSLAKKMNLFAAVIAGDVVLSLGVSILGTKYFGLVGYMCSSAIYSLIGIGICFITFRAPRLMGLHTKQLIQGSQSILLLYTGLLTASFLVFKNINPEFKSIMFTSEAVVALLGIALFWYTLQDEIGCASQWLKQQLEKRRKPREILVASK